MTGAVPKYEVAGELMQIAPDPEVKKKTDELVKL